MTRTVIDGAVALAGRPQLREIGAVGQGLHRPQREGRRGAPQDVRPGGEEGAGQGPGQELPVREHQHPRAEAVPAGPRASGCSADRYGPIAAPSRLPVPDSAAATHRACGNAPSRDWFEGRPKNASFSSLSGTSVTDPSIETTRSPQQNTPGAPSAPVGPATCSNSIRTGSAPSFPRPAGQRGDVRLLPPPALPGIHPAARVQLPGQQVRAAPLVIQAVGQLGHHLPVPAVPAPEQPQRQHEIHHQPGRQQPAALLPRPRRLDDLIDQVRRERPGQHPDRDPVRQPAVRRQTLSTIMSHKTVTLPHHSLRQGHWAVRVVAGANAGRRRGRRREAE